MVFASLSILLATTISATYTSTSTTIEDITFSTISNNETTTTVLCPEFGLIENGNWTFTEPLTLHIKCKPGYDLFGPSVVTCVHGQWDNDVPVVCGARCVPPPQIKYGTFIIEGKQSQEDGLYEKGTLVTYSCPNPYELAPLGSRYRVCEKGIWTGAMGVCRLLRNGTTCRAPPGITHGYVHEKLLDRVSSVKDKVRYVCNIGYVMIGDAFKECNPDGTWTPKFTPICSSPKTENLEDLCPISIDPHAKVTDIRRFQSYEAGSLVSGTEVDIECEPNYRNVRTPCQVARLRCISGKWVDPIPKCEFVKECPPPPPIPHATSFDNANFLLEGYGLRAYKYPINSKVTYQCVPGFETLGVELTCAPNGCWVPSEPPPLCRIAKRYYVEVAPSSGSGTSSSSSTPTTNILISFATGISVLLLLLIICLVLVYRRRKHSPATSGSTPLRRSGVLSGGGGGVGGGVVGGGVTMADHATLLQQQDRLALIAFADGGGPGGQPVLPTYEEATRERLNINNRLQRPHWPSLMVGRRARNSPNPDSIHVTRQGSFASHSASTRSGADSMGSTDTMAVSENSTTVTLDTASSHSGSQPASCRAHCGSLASFDTSSVLNTEGVPLLEESELEEIQCGDTVSLAMENRSMTDNASYKFSTASDA